MKILISCDMEGIGGVAKKTQVTPPGEDYSRARKLMTREINAASKGAFKKGATKVLVNDAHGGMDNILFDELLPGVELITGYPKALSMMEGIQYKIDLVFFIGYHSMKKRDGIISHTYNSSVVQNVKINEKDMGETGINANLAGYFGASVGLVSGDDVLVNEAREILGNDTSYVISKWAFSKYSAQNKSFQELNKELEKQAERALEKVNKLASLIPPSPVKIEVTFSDLEFARQALLMPGAKSPESKKDVLTSSEFRLSSPVVYYEAKDFLEAYRSFRAMLILANSAI